MKPTLAGDLGKGISMDERASLEERSIRMTIAGDLFMAGLGIGFALFTRSQAILLDGMFSFAYLLVALASLRVAQLLQRRDDERYPFGYIAFEPLLNLGKGLLVAAIALSALVSAGIALLSGGRPVAAGWAIFYAIVASLGCFVLAAVTRRFAEKSGSPIVRVDASEWLMDGAISLAVALAFAAAALLENTAYAFLAPYADPAVVFLLVLILLPTPLSIVRQYWGQVVGRAPEEQEHIREDIDAILEDGEVDRCLRVARFGRSIYVHLYILLPSDASGPLSTLAAQDGFRETLYQRLIVRYPDLSLDVVFTRDRLWADRSIAPA